MIMQLKLQVFGGAIGVLQHTWFQQEQYHIGFAACFCQGQWMVILGTQIAFEPNNLNGLLQRNEIIVWRFYCR